MHIFRRCCWSVLGSGHPFTKCHHLFSYFIAQLVELLFSRHNLLCSLSRLKRLLMYTKHCTTSEVVTYGTLVKVKVKVIPYSIWVLGPELIPVSRQSTRSWQVINPVVGCHYFDQYQIILLGDRGTCVWTTCPGSLHESGMDGIRTHDLWIASSTP